MRQFNQTMQPPQAANDDTPGQCGQDCDCETPNEGNLAFMEINFGEIEEDPSPADVLGGILQALSHATARYADLIADEA